MFGFYIWIKGRGVYTNVAGYKDWIMSVVGDDDDIFFIWAFLFFFL